MLPSTSAPGLRRLVIGCWLRLRLRNRRPPATLRALIASAPPPPAIATPPCRQLLSVRSEHAVSHSVPPEPPLPGSEPGHGYQVTSCPKGKRFDPTKRRNTSSRSRNAPSNAINTAKAVRPSQRHDPSQKLRPRNLVHCTALSSQTRMRSLPSHSFVRRQPLHRQHSILDIAEWS